MDDRPADEASGQFIHQPARAHVREEYETDEDLEATELRPVNNEDKAKLPRLSHVLSPGKPMIHWYDPIKKFWRHNVRISVPHEDCRDHLANERTYLGYLRTSVFLSMMGIVTLQLYRLQHDPHPSKVFGYFIVSKPLSAIFQGAALFVGVIGFIRFWRQQSAMALGKVHAGGWELVAIGIFIFILLLMMFAVLIGIDAYKADTPWY